MSLEKVHIKTIFIILIIFLVYILLNLPCKDSGEFKIDNELYSYSINRNINHEYNLKFCKNMDCIHYDNDNLPNKNTSVMTLFEKNFNIKFEMTPTQFNDIAREKNENIIYIYNINKYIINILCFILFIILL
jgi:hypothetical protein